MKVFNRIKEFADSQGMTAYALWKGTEISQPTLYRLYNEPELIPSGKVLEALASAFPDTTPNDWLKFEPDQPVPPTRSKRAKLNIRSGDRTLEKVEPMPKGTRVKNPAGWIGIVTGNKDGRILVRFDGGLNDSFPRHCLTVIE